MSDRVALRPSGDSATDADRARVAALEAQLTEREAALSALKIDLHALQARYLEEVGAFYAELSELEAAIATEEVRAGLRPPAVDVDDDGEADERDASGQDDEATLQRGCGVRSGPSEDLKRMFRDVAKAIHPDRAPNDPARWRRHSLMAEANRAYAERDADRLRLILHTWERSADAVLAHDAGGGEQARLQRQAAAIGERLVAIEAEFAGLRDSAIARLQRRIDGARAQGWDLFAEMIAEVKRELARAKARLAKLRRSSRPS